MPERKLTAEAVRGLTEAFLQRTYDCPVAIPDFHSEMWEMCCSDHPFVAIAAPRKHAKSTAITHAFSLAEVLFRKAKNVMILSNTEEQAIGFLSGIKQEINENEELQSVFGIAVNPDGTVCYDIEREKQIVVRFTDGEWFRIFIRGAGQRMRGAIYRHIRPDLIICDDLEDDQTTDNDILRAQFREWFLKVLLPIRSKKGKIRVVGTILHMDSLLWRLLKNEGWKSKLYKAHKSFDDFSERLWPAQWTEAELRRERQMFIEEGQPYVYSREYLNDPLDMPDRIFKNDDFIPFTDEDYDKHTINYVGVDFAIGKGDSADYNVFIVAGYTDEGDLLIKDVFRERHLDGEEIIDEFFWINSQHHPDVFFVEKGQIFDTMESSLIKEMEDRRTEITYEKMPTYRDKRVRSRPIQKMFRQGKVRVDMEADWWPAFKKELSEFDKGPKDDQVDAISHLAIGILYLVEAPSEDEMEEQEWEDELETANMYIGREKAKLKYTGYYA